MRQNQILKQTMWAAKYSEGEIIKTLKEIKINLSKDKFYGCTKDDNFGKVIKLSDMNDPDGASEIKSSQDLETWVLTAASKDTHQWCWEGFCNMHKGKQLHVVKNKHEYLASKLAELTPAALFSMAFPAPSSGIRFWSSWFKKAPKLSDLGEHHHILTDHTMHNMPKKYNGTCGGHRSDILALCGATQYDCVRVAATYGYLQLCTLMKFSADCTPKMTLKSASEMAGWKNTDKTRLVGKQWWIIGRLLFKREAGKADKINKYDNAATGKCEVLPLSKSARPFTSDIGDLGLFDKKPKTVHWLFSKKSTELDHPLPDNSNCVAFAGFTDWVSCFKDTLTASINGVQTFTTHPGITWESVTHVEGFFVAVGFKERTVVIGHGRNHTWRVSNLEVEHSFGELNALCVYKGVPSDGRVSAYVCSKDDLTLSCICITFPDLHLLVLQSVYARELLVTDCDDTTVKAVAEIAKIPLDFSLTRARIEALKKLDSRLYGLGYETLLAMLLPNCNTDTERADMVMLGAHQKGDFDNATLFRKTGIPRQDCPIVQAILKRYLEVVVRCKCASAFTTKRKRGDASSDDDDDDDDSDDDDDRLAVWGPQNIGPGGAEVYGLILGNQGIGPISCPGETRMKKLRSK